MTDVSKPSPFPKNREASPSDSSMHKTTHLKSDKDVDDQALHHTLGLGKHQAAPGRVVKQLNYAGLVQLFAGSAAPDGWLLCDGAAISRTKYADLFAAVGTTYGAGDGTTTFNLPNLKGRVPVGRDSGQAEFDVLGEVGGAKTHVLTTAEMPSHTHSIGANVDGALAHMTALDGSQVGNLPTAIAGYIISNRAIQNTGGGGAHNNLQPYIVMNYVIKT